jgi:hypothetical protein
MGMKVKGGMYCLNCQSPVPAQKSTHRLRNTVAGVTAPITGGYSLAAAASGEWHCQRCGGPVVSVGHLERQQKNQELATKPFSEWPISEQFYALIGGAIVLLIVIAIIVAAAGG